MASTLTCPFEIGDVLEVKERTIEAYEVIPSWARLDRDREPPLLLREGTFLSVSAILHELIRVVVLSDTFDPVWDKPLCDIFWDKNLTIVRRVKMPKFSVKRDLIFEERFNGSLGFEWPFSNLSSPEYLNFFRTRSKRNWE